VSLHLSATVAARGLDVAIDVPDGCTVAVLGPNGSGKSTLLAVAAGILRPDAGGAVLDGTTLFDTADGSWRAPHERGTGLLAQDPLLFPHLSALDNVAFGPRSTGASRRESRRQAHAWLAQVDADELADRKPSALSGGQAQRVAIARALAAEPRLLLLDEPMAALDVTVVPALRQVLRGVLRDRTAVLVTHDVLDALLLADRVVVMEQGRVIEEGPTREVLARPRSTFGAGIAGLNLVRGRAAGPGVRSPDGLAVEGIADPPVPDGDDAVAVFSPGAVGVYLERPTGSPRNVLASTVRELEPRGSQVRVRTDTVDADVTVPAVAELGLAPGSPVFLVVKASEVAIYAA
jgi:molybdate transport system ATP-binding protein